MPKVLSTKLKVDEVDRFMAIAKQQGESKAGLLKRLVVDYLNSRGKGGGAESTGSTIQAASPGKGLPPDKTYNRHGLSYCTSPLLNKPLSSEGLRTGGLVTVNHQRNTGSQTPSSPVTRGQSDIVDNSHRSNSLPSSKDHLPIHQNDSKGRPETNPGSSVNKGWLLFLLLLWLKSQRSAPVRRMSAFTRPTP